MFPAFYKSVQTSVKSPRWISAVSRLWLCSVSGRWQQPSRYRPACSRQLLCKPGFPGPRGKWDSHLSLKTSSSLLCFHPLSLCDSGMLVPQCPQGWTLSWGVSLQDVCKQRSTLASCYVVFLLGETFTKNRALGYSKLNIFSDESCSAFYFPVHSDLVNFPGKSQ